MKWLNNLKVGGKLTLGFSIMILMVAIIGLNGYRSLQHMEHDLEEIATVRLPGITNLTLIDRDLHRSVVAERSMIFANPKSDIFKGLVEDYDVSVKHSDERWTKFKGISSSNEEAALIAQYDKARGEWKGFSRKVVDGRISDTREGRREALDLSLGLAKQKFEEMRNYLDHLTHLHLKKSTEAIHAAEMSNKKTTITMLFILGLGVLIGMILAFSITRGITKPLKAVIERLSEASGHVASGSGQVSSSSQQLAEGASEQAASIEETSSALEEMASMTKQNADNAHEAKNRMQEASIIIAKVSQHMEGMAVAIEDITRSSKETEKIVKTIDEIAFQTNLLALNAAVEAARAGEAGAGFAVVADEVRNLAMRAAEAAKNTSDLIENTIKAIQNGNELTQSTRVAFKENMEISGKVGNLVEEIAAASQEQAQGIEQINRTVMEMDKVVQQVAANAEESSSSSEEMNAQAGQMKHMVNELIDLVGQSSGSVKSEDEAVEK